MIAFSERPTWADIDLTALRHNLGQAQGCCLETQRLLAVVKADAYGHGAVPVTRALQQCGITDFAVATLEEGLELRAAGVADPILVLGGCFPGQEGAFVEHQLMPALFDADLASRLGSEAIRRGKRARVHLKVDSGMGRVGFRREQLQEFIPRLQSCPGLEIAGFMSHLACADELDSSVTGAQLDLFLQMLDMLRQAGIAPPDVHLNNSAGLVAWNRPEFTLARPGIMLYGGLPGADFADRVSLRPVMNLRTRIAQLRELPAGIGVSYGHSFHAPQDMKIAVLPIGYADGYNRLLSNRGRAILHGRIVPVVGRVCMDWIMLDVTGIEQAKVGDCVTLLGAADGLVISGDDWAGQLETISYEVFCRIGGRVPRRYPTVAENG